MLNSIKSWWRARDMARPVSGTLTVTTATTMADHATSQDYKLWGVVQGEGIEPVAVEHHGVANVQKWPRPGMVLPVRVDQADPTRIKVLWDEVPRSHDVAAQQAAAMAELMRRER